MITGVEQQRLTRLPSDQDVPDQMNTAKDCHVKIREGMEIDVGCSAMPGSGMKIPGQDS